MKWKIFKKTVFCCFLSSFLIISGNTTAFCTELPAETSSLETTYTGASEAAYVTRNVSQDEIAQYGISSAIQNALNEARDSATESRPYQVIVPAGSYTLNNCLHIYSNTCLVTNGVTFKQTKNRGTNMLKVGDTEDTNTGYYYQNITIDGGTWNENGNNSTAFKAAHATNVTLQNLTIRNAKNAHLMEVAGVNGLTIRNCTFKDQVLESKNTLYFEAIQLDVLIASHINGYVSEDLNMQNVTIDQCTFDNVPRGVGSHTAILNNYVKGVRITNCSFKNIKSAAIQSMNWINCTISNNTISNSQRGICLYSIRESGTFLATSTNSKNGPASSTSTKYVAPPADQQIVIENNQITCSGKDPFSTYDNSGIYIGGYQLNSSNKGGDGDRIPAGDYYISGVTITNNTIKSSGYGIWTQDAKEMSITGNTISSSGKHGIAAEKSSISSIKKNKITKSKGISIFTDGSAVSEISQNKISNGSNSACVVVGLKSNLKITSNTISKCNNDSIALNPGNYKYLITINKNKVTGAGKPGLLVYNGKIDISDNTFQSNSNPLVTTGDVKGTIGVNKFSKNKTNAAIVNQKVHKNISAPTAFKASKKGKKVTLSWKKSKDADYYIVYRSTSSNSGFKKIATVKGKKTRYTDVSKTVKSKKRFYYKVVPAAAAPNAKITLTGTSSKTVSVK